MRCLISVARVGGVAACAVVGLLTVIGLQPVLAIDVKLSAEEAQKALEAGRVPMEPWVQALHGCDIPAFVQGEPGL